MKNEGKEGENFRDNLIYKTKTRWIHMCPCPLQRLNGAMDQYGFCKGIEYYPGLCSFEFFRNRLSTFFLRNFPTDFSWSRCFWDVTIFIDWGSMILYLHFKRHTSGLRVSFT